MIVVGIDPGTIRLGYAAIERKPLRLVEAGVAEASARKPRSVRLVTIGKDVDDILAEFRPDLVAFETAKWGGHPSAAGALGEIRGVLLWLCHLRGIRTVDLAPAQIRKAIGAGGGATKAQVASLVQAAVGLRRRPSPDAADAIAVALAAASAA